MREKLNPSDIARFTTFAAAMSAATARVIDFSARLATLSKLSDAAALQITKLLSTAVQKTTLGQQMTTCCQCTSLTPSDRAGNLATVQQVFVSGTALIASVAVLLEALKWLWTTGGPVATSGTAKIGPFLVSLWRAVSAGELVAVVAATAAELVAAVAGVAASVPIAAIVTATAVLARAAYLMWRNWSAVVAAIRELETAISHEAVATLVKIAVAGEREYGYEDPIPANDSRSRRSRWSNLKSIAPTMFDSIGANIGGVWPFPVLASVYASSQNKWQGAGAFRGAGAAMLAAPLLVAPALAAIPSARPGIDALGGASIVINSTPTIVINSSQPDDIEHRVQEALKHHREAIYEQWSSEFQRRQRTEF